MKLYATVTSERASKGQGGNKYLIIEVKAERFDGIPTRANQYRLSLSADPTSNKLYAEILNYSNGEVIVLTEKGKKETGEVKRCKWCKRAGSMDYTNQQKPFCHSCKQSQ